MASPVLLETVQAHPVVSTLYGISEVAAFLDSESRVALVANVDLIHLRPLVAMLSEREKIVMVNIDACPGVAQDRGGLEYLKWIGAVGIVSTRGSLVEQARACGLSAVQKVFVTDRSNLPRIHHGLTHWKPDLVQIMPAPILSCLEGNDIRAFGVFIVSGFVSSKAEVDRALRLGAVGVSSSDKTLWGYRPSEDSNESNA